MSSNRRPLIIGLGLVIVVIAVASLGFLLQSSPSSDSQAPSSNESTSSPQLSPSPSTTTSSDSPSTSYQPPQKQPTGWSYFYDGALDYLAAYPSDYRLSPAANLEFGESAFYSFTDEDNTASGPVPEDELKIAVVFRPSGNDFFSRDDIPDTAQEVMVDDKVAHQFTSPNQQVRSTAVVLQNGDIYVIRAYPANSELIDTYTQFLEYLDFDALSPIEITQTQLREDDDGHRLELRGYAPGTWFYEAQMTAELEAPSILNETVTSPAKAESDWMTTSWVPFSVSFSLSSQDANVFSNDTPVLVTFNKSNPSGIPMNNFTYTQPIIVDSE